MFGGKAEKWNDKEKREKTKTFTKIEVTYTYMYNAADTLQCINVRTAFGTTCTCKLDYVRGGYWTFPRP